MRARVPGPIRDALESDVDEERVHALWTATEAEIARRRYGRAPRRALVVSTIIAVSACVALASAWSRTPDQSEAARSLALADGSAPVAVEAFARVARVELADGSWLSLAPGGRFAPIENDHDTFALALERGRMELSVTPGGLRRWRVDCGAVTVEVVGTVFTVERRPDVVHVQVGRGVVAVRGAPVPDGERLLGAGEAISIQLVAPAPSVPEAERAPMTAVAEVLPAELPSEHQRARQPRTRDAWRALADRGEHEAAYEILRAGGVVERASGASARELLLLADVARFSGHPADAVLPLERILDEHPLDSEAPLAAIILARIERDRGRHARAAQVFERAIALGVPSSLDEAILAERAVALFQAGDLTECARAARAYLANHPDGAHVADVRVCSDER